MYQHSLKAIVIQISRRVMYQNAVFSLEDSKILTKIIFYVCRQT